LTKMGKGRIVSSGAEFYFTAHVPFVDWSAGSEVTKETTGWSVEIIGGNCDEHTASIRKAVEAWVANNATGGFDWQNRAVPAIMKLNLADQWDKIGKTFVCFELKEDAVLFMMNFSNTVQRIELDGN
jgi:hypothetical protein